MRTGTNVAYPAAYSTLLAAKNAGHTLVRTTVHPDHTTSLRDGTPEALPELVNNAQKVGVDLVLMIGPLRTLEGGKWAGVTGADAVALAAMCGRIAARYKGQVYAYQIGNEPNAEYFWSNPDPAAYVAFLKLASMEIRRNDPDALVWSAGLANLETPKTLAFLNDAMVAGMAGACDAIGVHCYRHGSTPEVTLDRLLPSARTVVDARSKGKPFAITEAGWLARSTTHPTIQPEVRSRGPRPNLLPSLLSFLSGSVGWTGYWRRPGATVIKDPEGKVSAVRFASVDSGPDGVGDWGGIYAKGKLDVDRRYVFSCYLRSDGAPFRVRIGLDDGSCKEEWIDGLWRPYSYTGYPTPGAGRMGQIWEEIRGNPAICVAWPETTLYDGTILDLERDKLARQADYVDRFFDAAARRGDVNAAMHYAFEDEPGGERYGETVGGIGKALSLHALANDANPVVFPVAP